MLVQTEGEETPVDVVTASFGLGEVLLTVLEIFLFVAWIWVLVSVISDLFGDHTVSGWGKAAWTIALVLLPFLGVFVYLIARGDGMHERTAKRQAEARTQFESYIRQTAATPTDELAKLADLRDRGVLSEGEFEQAKGRLLSGGGSQL
jgi:Phospholipase_D-nuclease N-terminal/Short C-terminal domain